MGAEKQDSDVLPCFGKRFLISAQPTPAGFLYGIARFETFRDIKDSLIAAASEVEFQTSLRQHERAVNEHIQLGKQISLRLGAAQ